MKISYFLTRPTVETETSIYARICYAGYKFKYYIPETINPKFWNKEKRRGKETAKFIGYSEFNTRLDNIQGAIKNTFRTFVNDTGTTPDPLTLRGLLDIEIRKMEPEKKAAGLLPFFKEVIDQSKKGIRLHHKTGKTISPNTVKTYETTYKHISAFQATRKKAIDFKSIDLDFYRDYTEYLMKGKKIDPKTKKPVSLNLGANTVGKHIQIIKLLMNEATERGLNTNMAFKSKRFITVRENTDNIYLTAEQILEIEGLDLSKNTRLEKVRDLFLIGCYTGLRYSDYSILQPGQIKDGFIETTQTKTGNSIVIPIHATVKRIIEKYNGRLPAAISNQKTNDFLKEIGNMVTSLQEQFTRTFTKGGVKVSKNVPKCELLTTHTARRSFATNEFLAGTPTLTIMAITGHRTEKSFLRYIKLTPNEHAKLLKTHWDKRSRLKVG